MFTIRTLARATRNRRLLTSCKEPDKKYKISQFIIFGLAAVPAAPIVKYQYDKFVYNREMVKYEERIVHWRESWAQHAIANVGTSYSIPPPQKPDPPMISLFGWFD